MYGEKSSWPVEKRLERELNSIISNGYAVMYIIAQKLVWKSNERRLSGWLPWIGWVLVCGYYVRNYRGQSSAARITAVRMSLCRILTLRR